MKRLIVVLFIFLFGCAAISDNPPAMPESPPVMPESPPVMPESPPVMPESPPVMPESPVVMPESPVVMPEEIAKADYGLHPDNYQEIVRAYMSEKLLDPYSAVYSKWEAPQKGYTGDSMIGYSFGYRVDVGINAKDGMGGYVGIKSHYFVIHNDNVIKHGIEGIEAPWITVP